MKSGLNSRISPYSSDICLFRAGSPTHWPAPTLRLVSGFVPADLLHLVADLLIARVEGTANRSQASAAGARQPRRDAGPTKESRHVRDQTGALRVTAADVPLEASNRGCRRWSGCRGARGRGPACGWAAARRTGRGNARRKEPAMSDAQVWGPGSAGGRRAASGAAASRLRPLYRWRDTYRWRDGGIQMA